LIEGETFVYYCKSPRVNKGETFNVD